MKTPEDEAFEDIDRRQRWWGGGYQAKRQAAMDKINSHFDAAYKKMHEDRAMYGTSWPKDGERIDPASVYLEQPASDYERGFIDGMQKQAQSSVDKAVNQMAQPAQEPKREWVGLTEEELHEICNSYYYGDRELVKLIEAKLKEKNT
jgi:hypothetical protein